MIFYRYKMMEIATGKITTITLPKSLSPEEFQKAMEILNDLPHIYGVVYFSDGESCIEAKVQEAL